MLFLNVFITTFFKLYLRLLIRNFILVLFCASTFKPPVIIHLNFTCLLEIANQQCFLTITNYFYNIKLLIIPCIYVYNLYNNILFLM
jgi:hypothetical protein